MPIPGSCSIRDDCVVIVPDAFRESIPVRETSAPAGPSKSKLDAVAVNLTLGSTPLLVKLSMVSDNLLLADIY